MEFFLWLIQFLCLLLLDLHFQASCYPFESLNSSFSSSKLLCPYEQSHALLQFKSSFSINTSASVSAVEEEDYMFRLKYDPFDPFPKYATAYSKTESWKEGTDCCLWDGVTCDLKSGNVIALNLSSSMLFGNFHSNNSLFFLSHLQKLDLSNNDFNGSIIPSQFGQLLNLTHLNLDRSYFVGQVPSQISHLTNLVSLDLSWNYGLTMDTISFSMLVQNLTNLKEFILREVDLSTVAPSSFTSLSSSLSFLNLELCSLSTEIIEYINLPSELISLDLADNFYLRLNTNAFVKLVKNLTKLKELDLHFVDLSSVAPSSLMNVSSSLTYLRLSSCKLQGKFLNNIHFSKLIYLDVLINQNLTIDNMTINKLAISSNLSEVELSFVNMSSVAPTTLMNLSSSLSYLSLRDCGLQGEFPGNLLQRPNFQLLSLLGNVGLTGFSHMSNWSNSLQLLDASFTKIPIYLELDFISNLRSLKDLRLRSCNFIGSNLALISLLSQLTWLDLSNNNFNGEIPPSFGNLQKLTYLDLSSSNFSGDIPPSFANLNQLIELHLQNNSLTGPLPPYFSNFTQLRQLELQNNRFIGSIPSQVSRLSSLSLLDLSNNFFNSSIPSSLFSLPNLVYLSLKNNEFQGHIGQIQGESFFHIDLSKNKLQGSIPSSVFNLMDLRALILSSNIQLMGELSSSVCNLQSLQILDLSNNSFSGFIPQCLGNFSSDMLSVLHLGMNNFVGAVPAIFSESSSLRYVNFNGNQLRGGIPPSIVNCENLEILDLGNNEINDTFPFFLASLPNLQVLVLRSNKLHGSLQCPIANCSFPELRIVDVSNNTLSGPLPAEFFNELQAMMMNFNSRAQYMFEPTGYVYDYSVSLTMKGWENELPKIQTYLATIDLSLNKFIGKIPNSIGKLKSLKQLNVSHNYLTGNIPPSLGNLSNLESLDLSSNSLTGRIPMELENLTFLEVFSVAHNQLEGPIPSGKQFNTFGNDSYEGNLGLCGPPLSKACENDDSQVVQQSHKQEEEDSDWVNGFGWRAVMIGYGCGLILGFSMAYIVFTTWKPAWFVKMVEGEWTQKAKGLRRYLLGRNGRRH